MSDAYDLRARWKRAQPVLDELDRGDRQAHLDQSIGDRLLQTIRLGEAAIQAYPDHLDEPDDEHLVWRRMHDHLHNR